MSKGEAIEHLRVAEETFAAAKVLHAEGLERDSVGRAYYAMFHAAQAVLVARGIAVRTHKGILHKIHESFTGKDGFAPELVAAIARTQKLREAADYDVVASIGDTDARQSIEVARRILDRARQLVE